MDTEKRRLRKQMTSLRNALNKEEIQEKSQKIFKQLAGMDIYRQAEIILSYGSFRNEVFTWEFHRQVVDDRKILALPKVISSSEMKFYSVKDFSQLTRGYMGILEPGPDCRPIDGTKGSGMILVPGLAFDRRGFRLGYGGGYYDRYLSEISSKFRKVGLGFDFQILDQIPIQMTDMGLDMIVTESRIYERADGE